MRRDMYKTHTEKKRDLDWKIETTVGEREFSEEAMKKYGETDLEMGIPWWSSWLRLHIPNAGGPGSIPAKN